jgi:hypothetical protein
MHIDIHDNASAVNTGRQDRARHNTVQSTQRGMQQQVKMRYYRLDGRHHKHENGNARTGPLRCPLCPERMHPDRGKQYCVGSIST